MNIYITAIIKSKSEYFLEVASVLENMVMQSRKEAACILYDLHQSTADKNTFIFYEIWASQEGLQKHNNQSYIKQFSKCIKEKLQEAPQIFITNKI